MDRLSDCTPNQGRNSCRCISECTCKALTPSRSYPSESDYWTVNPCRPWMASLFSSPSSSAYESTIGPSNNDDKLSSQKVFPTQARRKTTQKKIPSSVALLPGYNIVGHPSLRWAKDSSNYKFRLPQHLFHLLDFMHPCLRIYKFRLPQYLFHLLDFIVEACDDHASTLPNGWEWVVHTFLLCTNWRDTN